MSSRMNTLNSSQWTDICALEEIPPLGSRRVNCQPHPIAIFRDAGEQLFALTDRCPHKGGPLSQGLIFGQQVACPLHNWHIDLASGEAVAPDVGCVQRHEVKLEQGRVWLNLPAQVDV